MPSKQVIFTDKAPAPLKGIYSQAIVANGTVYCSGSIGMDPATGKLIDGDVKDRTVRLLTLSETRAHEELTQFSTKS